MGIEKNQEQPGPAGPRSGGHRTLRLFASVFRFEQKRVVVTPVLIYLNAAIFALMVLRGMDFFSPDAERLIDWGANYGPLTLGGQWWRLITSTFLHAGILHLGFNMFALLYLGILLEPWAGWERFTAVYFLSGLAASVASLHWHRAAAAVGASGAIMGLCGMFLAVLTTPLPTRAMKRALLPPILFFAFFNLVGGRKMNVDLVAHLGGFVCGVALGYLFYPSLRNPADRRLRRGSLLAATALVVAVTVVLYRSSLPHSRFIPLGP